MMRFTQAALAIALCHMSLAISGLSWGQDSLEAVEETAAPQWQICNETSFILRLATAQSEDGTTRIKGWKKLRPSECALEETTPVAQRFLYAESDAVHNGGIREWAGRIPICLNPAQNFNIDANVSCALQGLETRRFLRIAPTDLETELIEPDDFGKKAATAGLQRLMQDAGYKITRIDGIDGRRTRNTLRRFLKANDVSSDLAVFDKMDALASAALLKQGEIGLTICNQSAVKTWTAIGYRESGAWQSRGWWALEPLGCIRPWSKDLMGTEMHVYAQQSADDERENLILKNPVDTANNFCVAEAKFSALGREFCSDKGYIFADFRPIPTDEKGYKVNLEPDDFITAPDGGLRQ